MRDLASNIGAVQAIAPAVQSATVESSEVDLVGFNSAAVIISTGAIAGSGAFSAKVQEADFVDSPPDFDDVDASQLIGTLPATLEANKVYRVGYIGNHRYIRVVLTKASGTSIAAGVVVVKGDPAERPVAA
jgi:hypothetical protein